MSEVRNLEPKSVWNHFEDLNAVPRPSKKEERVIAFAKSFGESLGLETYVDRVGNVIIRKPATPGMENRQTIIMQAHLDMVHQKNNDTVFDFDSEGIRSYIDGEWVSAEGTTLGADNGMGVAAIMAVLSSSDIEHPAIEALFTIDEETGMTGAFELEQGILDGTILLNLDTEDDDELSIGCAGGIDTNTLKSYPTQSIEANYRIVVKGLKGGHSGMDINLGRGNANKLMNRILHAGLKHNIQILSIDGGSLRNAIPRESNAYVKANNDFAVSANEVLAAIVEEYQTIEPNITLSIEEITQVGEGISAADSAEVIHTIAAVHNGVFRMSPNIEGLVETSSSLARVIVQNGEFKTQSLQRSSVESSKLDVASTVAGPFHLAGCNVEHTGSYPGWAPNPDSPILNLMKEKYIKLFNENPQVKACHAGLECGILGERYPGLDMISFGPTIRNPHSPDEKVNIQSVQKFWKYLLDVLKDIPAKN